MLAVAGLAVAGIAVLLVAAALQPDNFRIERKALINAPPEKIFPLLNDFREWRKWSPWENVDPQLKRTYRGKNEGVGAIYEWSGNGQAGAGKMEIVRSDAPHSLLVNLDFISPMPAHNEAEFTLTPQGDQTEVQWIMRGESPFIHKVFSLLMDMDAMLGGYFETGLKALGEHATAS